MFHIYLAVIRWVGETLLSFLSAKRNNLLIFPPEPMMLMGAYSVASPIRSVPQSFLFFFLYHTAKHTYRTYII